MNESIKKGLIGTYAFVMTISISNMTQGLFAYMMVTYSEVSKTQIQMIASIPAIVGAIFAFICGNIVSKVGVKKMALFIQSSVFLSGMIFLFFGNKTSIYVLYLASALYGLNNGGQAVVSSQYYKRLIPDEKKRSAYLGYGSAIGSLTSTVFSTVGGIIAAKNFGQNWERAYLLYFVILVCIIVEFICLPPDEKNSGESFNNTSLKKADDGEKVPAKAWLIAGHYLVFSLLLYVFGTNISEYIINIHKLGTSAQTGLCLSFMTIGGIISGLLFGTYSKLLKNWTMPVLLSGAALGLLLMNFVPKLYAVFLASALLGFPLNGCGACIMMEMSRIAKGSAYAKAMSIYSGLMNAGMSCAVYILAFVSKLVYGDPNYVMGKFMIAFVGAVLTVIASVFIYGIKNTELQKLN